MFRSLAVAAAAALFSLAAFAASAEEAAPSMTLSGVGEVFAAPDMAIVTSGVVTEAKTAREALDANNAAMAAVVEAMKGAGIAAEDLQTSDFSVEPRWVYPNEKENKAPFIAGYTVSNQLAVKVRDLEKLGGVLDQAVSLGSNQIRGISFAVADDTPLMDAARAAAVKDAMRKARLYAENAEVTLGAITAISEGAVGGQPPVLYARSFDKGAGVPVEAGTLSFRADVRITWALGK